ncbi:MAG: 30S ribosomal protein S12 methylthiotransferase RimO [Candidatus Margulisiibacteriota bacterium]
MKVGVVSLGCPKNLVDTEVMLSKIVGAGHTIVQAIDSADVLILNTCAFIEAARAEARQEIASLSQFKKKYLIVTGCYPKLAGDKLFKDFPNINGLVSCGNIDRIVAAIDKVKQGSRVSFLGGTSYLGPTTARVRATPSYTAYVKIADGCSHGCSFCTIPRIRGPYRSRKIEEIVKEVKMLAQVGTKEINLVAQDTTNYGRDRYGKPVLAGLLRKIVKIEGIKWVRIMYAHPDHLTDELTRTIAQEGKICKYLDLPLQHGSDKILKAMGRRMGRRAIIDKITRIRRQVPGIAIRSAFIVGFPGETEKEFRQLLSLLKELALDRVGVFTYSPEAGTRAAKLGNRVADSVSQKRYDRAMQLQSRISNKVNQKYVGKILEVLIEGHDSVDPSVWRGRSFRDAPAIDGLVMVKAGNFRPGDMVRCLIAGATDYDLIGEEIDERR